MPQLKIKKYKLLLCLEDTTQNVWVW